MQVLQGKRVYICIHEHISYKYNECISVSQLGNQLLIFSLVSQKKKKKKGKRKKEKKRGNQLLTQRHVNNIQTGEFNVMSLVGHKCCSCFWGYDHGLMSLSCEKSELPKKKNLNYWMSAFFIYVLGIKFKEKSQDFRLINIFKKFMKQIN